MLLLESTHQKQSALAQYCLTGETVHIPGTKTDHLPHYRRLVRSVFNDILENAYPVLFDWLPEDSWSGLLDDFMSRHHCRTPQVWKMPGEFREFLVSTNHPLLEQHPCIPDLLLFEWTELELFMSDDRQVPCQKSGHLQSDRLVLNPEHRLLHLQYPVHRQKPNDINPDIRADYFLIAHRNREGDVLFTECAPALLRMIEYLEEQPLSAPELIRKIESEYGIRIQGDEQENMYQFLKQAAEQALIIGYQLNNHE